MLTVCTDTAQTLHWAGTSPYETCKLAPVHKTSQKLELFSVEGANPCRSLFGVELPQQTAKSAKQRTFLFLGDETGICSSPIIHHWIDEDSQSKSEVL